MQVASPRSQVAIQSLARLGPERHRSGPPSLPDHADGLQLEVDVVGARGKISLVAAPWHLFAGDETYIPATFAMLEALPADLVYDKGTIYYGALKPLPHALDAKFDATPSELNLNPFVLESFIPERAAAEEVVA